MMFFNISKNQTNHHITKDTPLFCYVSENKQNFVAKLQDIELSLNINLDTTLTKDENNKTELISTKLIFLSFIPFKNDKEANTKSSQKFQLTHKDLEKACKIINFNIPYAYLNESEMFGEWEEESKEIEENFRLSGKEWVKEYKDKASIEDLSSPFKENVKDFLNAINEAKNKTPQAKIAYYISSTRRPYERAVLMHYCYKVAHNIITPQQAQIETQKENIPINWIHTDSNGNYSEKISREKALEMKNAYGIAYPASLTSHHVKGNAIDITITWQSSFTIKDKTGKEYTIDTPRNGAINKILRAVGETYGVKRTLEKDPPHWSLEGN